MLNNKLISVFCSLGLLTSLYAKPLSLENLKELALVNNTKIKISDENINISKEEINKSKSSFYPSISLNADYGQYDMDNGGNKQDGIAKGVSLSANQLLYDFGKTKSQVSLGKSNLEVSLRELFLNKKSLNNSITNTYYDILNKYQQIFVAKEAVTRDELQLEQAQEYFKAGIRTQIDITNAKLQLSNSKLSLVQKEYALKLAKNKLTSILGKALNKDDEIIKDKTDIESLSKEVSFEIKSLEELITKALNSRLELEKYKYQLKANRDSLNGINKEYYPRLDLSASYSKKDSDDIKSLESEQTNLLLNLKWNLYTGNSTKANKRISISRIKSTKEQIKQQKLQIEEEVSKAFYNVKQSFDSIKIALLSLNLSKENLNLAQQRYKAGLNDLLELNDAKLEYTKSKSSLVDTYYSYKINEANLEFTLGK